MIRTKPSFPNPQCPSMMPHGLDMLLPLERKLAEVAQDNGDIEVIGPE